MPIALPETVVTFVTVVTVVRLLRLMLGCIALLLCLAVLVCVVVVPVVVVSAVSVVFASSPPHPRRRLVRRRSHTSKPRSVVSPTSRRQFSPPP